DIDANGIVNVSAQDKGTGHEQHITITASSNLSKEDIDRAVREAEQFAAEDAKRKEDIDTRNQGDQMVYQAEQFLSENGDKLDSADKSAIEDGKSRLQDALKGSDTAAIKTAVDDLTKTFYDVSAKLYQQQAPQDGGAQGGSYQSYQDPNQGGGNDQDYQDADYEVVDDDK
ncbi:MAG: Hsp70 family protein, partial [Clostridiales bacterium]|nr:Hsp70 family protein [Clostridiales bacterium]